MAVYKNENGDWIIQDSKGMAKRTDSQQEARFAIALEKYQWPYEYQASFFDPRLITIIDFRVFTIPQWTPVFIDGEYWHNTPQQREKDTFARNLLFAAMKGRAKRAMSIPAGDLKTQEQADTVVLMKFGRN